MSILDSITSAVGGSGGGNITDTIMGLINKEGGLQGLISKLNLGGLGDTVSSWVGTGANKPVSGAEISNALGSDEINQIAEQTGLPAEQVSAQIAEHLPTAIDKLTPTGTVPEGNIMDNLGGMLKGLF